LEFLKIQDGGGRRLENYKKIVISPQQFDRSCEHHAAVQQNSLCNQI